LERKNKNPKIKMNPDRSPVALPTDSAPTQTPDTPGVSAYAGSLDAVQIERPLNEGSLPGRGTDTLRPPRQHGALRWALFAGITCALLAGGIFTAVERNRHAANGLQAGNFGIVHIPLSGLDTTVALPNAADTIQINGSVQVGDSVPDRRYRRH
jgi:hypothetical protein